MLVVKGKDAVSSQSRKLNGSSTVVIERINYYTQPNNKEKRKLNPSTDNDENSMVS